MVLGFPVLLCLLASDQAQSNQDELAAYEECRRARRPTVVWVVDVEDAWLRAGETSESPTKGILHRGQAVTLLKRGSRSLLVKTEENQKGWIWNEEVIERVYPPQIPLPADECPQPSFFRDLCYPFYYLPPQMPFPGPSPEDLKSLELDEPASGQAADSASGAQK